LSQAESQTVSRAKSAAGGYFTLILQPPAQLPESDITPKELVFVLDTSGSMMGFPIEKAKELINHALDELYPGDTFNLITFSGDTRVVFPEPVFPTAEKIRKAREVLNAQHGGGGTVMMNAIRAALAPSDSQDHLRVVCFLTDGYVGNDLDIIGEVQKHPNARVFAYGIGNSVNRFLITSMAKAGRGDSEVVTLNDNADAAAHRLYQRLRSPVLTDVSIDWRGLPVTDVFPSKIPDLFTGKPLVITGRYTAASTGSIVIHGKRAGDDFTREVPVHFNTGTTDSNILSSFWARQKIDALMSQDWAGLQSGSVKPEVQNEITQLGLSYGLMTQFTSFVAVEERVVTTDGKPQRVEVPVEMPEGVSYEGIFGDKKDVALYAPQAGLTMSANVAMAPTVSGKAIGGPLMMRKMAAPPPAGVGVGSGGGVGGGVYHGAAASAPPPPPPDTKPKSERALLESKLSPTILARYDCWKKQAANCKLAPDGTVKVQLFLTQDPAVAIEQLKAAGLTVSRIRQKEKAVIGRLPLDKLAELAKLETVKFIAPVRG
jgi:Ca-activated chloride channel family protein